MNADRLLALYDRVAEAPDAVGRMRSFVLELAVRGKLVRQDPVDEPASELLKQIKVKKQELVKAKIIRKPKLLPDLDPSQLSFTLPRSWCWARIDDLSPRSLTDGDWIETKDQSEDGRVRLIQLADVGVGAFLDKSARFVTEETEVRLRCTRLTGGDILIARLPNPIGRACIFPNIGQPAITAVDVAILRTDRNSFNKYIEIAINAPSTREQIEAYGKGATRFRVSTGHLKTIVLPLPPLAEQHRIVAKVDELMVLCDQLEEARTAREDTRHRLTKASLTRLNSPDVDVPTFRSHARFAVDAIPALTARTDQVKQLRQTILNLAFCGKLVEQDPQEGSGRDIHARITSARPSSPQSESVLKAIDGMYPLPSNWTWASLGQAIVAGPRNGLSPRRSAREDAPRAVTLTATTSGIFDGSHFKRVDADIGPDSEYWLKPNDLLFQRGNTPEYVGMAAIYDGPPGEFIFPDLMIRVRLSPEVNLRFAHLFCVSPAARSYFSENATGAQKTMPKINQAILRALPIPLPPLSEQHRIVVKVDELMALCDRIEAGLAATDDNRSRLLESILHNALTSAGHEPATAGRLEA